jgi:hypothetical protein
MICHARQSRHAWLTVALIGSYVLAPALTWACAVCWGGNDVASRGLNISIMFLMSMPFVIGGSILGVIYVAHKRAQGLHWWELVSKAFPSSQKENPL